MSSILAFIIFSQQPVQAQSSTFNVTVTAAPTKTDGYPWDAADGPDLKLCSVDTFGNETCFGTICKNRHKCTWSSIVLPNAFLVRVWDVDMMSHDEVGLVSCNLVIPTPIEAAVAGIQKSVVCTTSGALSANVTVN